jgi:hypothetical protein
LFLQLFILVCSRFSVSAQASENRLKQAACRADARAEIQPSTSTPDRANRRLS